MMNSFLKKIFWVLFFAAAVYGGYSYYSRDTQSFIQIKKNVFDFLSETAGNAGQIIHKEIKDKEEIFKSVKQSAKDYLQEKTAETFSGFGEKLQGLADQINPGKSFQAGNVPAAIVVKKGDFFSISVRGTVYSVDWGDGVEEKNVPVNKNNRITISHRWSKEGDHLVKIEVGDGNVFYADSFLVRVSN